MTFENIPQELRENGLFCLWKYEERNGKATKPPYSPHGGYAKSDHPETFTSFELALAAYHGGGFEGLGLGIFNGFCAIDIDHCLSPNGVTISDMARDIIHIMDSYTEISPSGQGIRILFKAPGFQYDKQRYYINNQKKGLEIYIEGATKKYVTVTGRVWQRKPIAERGEQVAVVLEKYMKRQNAETTPRTAFDTPDYLQRGLEKDKKLFALWNGQRDTTDESGNDLALFNELAYWCDRDEARMIDAFLRSPYADQKDDAHKQKLQRDDYLHNTAQMAVNGCQRTAMDDDAAYRQQQAVNDFGALQPPSDSERLTINTARQALQELGITIRYNQLLKEAEVSGLPACYSSENAVNVLPVYLMDYLKECGLKGVTRQAVDGCLNCIADQNRYNPIRELLQSAPWDGVDRLPEIYRILGVDQEKHRNYIRKWLIQCVALGLNDESSPIGADGVLVLQGPQGVAKTSFFRIMSPFPRWFVEGAIIDMGNKDTQITALSGWITELGELDSTLKKEQMALKAFVTRPEDRIRVPYARTDTRMPRRTSFCGTVNPEDYLRDETGSRRFWTVPIRRTDKKALFSLRREWVNQLWFQVYRMYLDNPLGFRLTDAEMKQIQEDNRAFEVPLPGEMEIMEHLDFSLPTEEWEWWGATEVKARVGFNGDVRQLGKALKRVVDAISPNPPHPPLTTDFCRISRGRAEYLIPMKKFITDWGGCGG